MKRSDSLWRFACREVFPKTCKNNPFDDPKNWKWEIFYKGKGYKTFEWKRWNEEKLNKVENMWKTKQKRRHRLMFHWPSSTFCRFWGCWGRESMHMIWCNRRKKTCWTHFSHSFHSAHSVRSDTFHLFLCCQDCSASLAPLAATFEAGRTWVCAAHQITHTGSKERAGLESLVTSYVYNRALRKGWGVFGEKTLQSVLWKLHVIWNWGNKILWRCRYRLVIFQASMIQSFISILFKHCFHTLFWVKYLAQWSRS